MERRGRRSICCCLCFSICIVAGSRLDQVIFEGAGNSGVWPSHGLAERRIDPAEIAPRLQVPETKFRRSRLVPSHPSTADALGTCAQEGHGWGYDGLCDFCWPWATGSSTP